MTHSNLIPVFSGSIQHTQIQLCNARELHAFLEIGKEYANWIKDRIADYGFVQDEDYIIVTERTNGRPRKEYHITLDMGKELGMVERNERGRQIRKYFIECEKRAKQQQQQLALPEPLKFTVELTEHDLQQLVWGWFVLSRGIDTMQQIYPAMEKLGSKHSGAIYGQAFEYLNVQREMHKTLMRITDGINADPMNNWRALNHLRAFNSKKRTTQLPAF